MADRGVAGQRPDGDPGRVDEHVELIGEGDAVAGDHVDLGLDRFVAVAGQDQRWAQPGLGQDVVEQSGGRAVVGPDPGLAGQVPEGEHRPVGQRMAGREQDPGGVGEQRHQLDVGGRRVGLEAVLEHEGNVQLPGGQPPEGGAAVDQLVLQVQVGQAGLGEGGHRRGELGEGGEEGAEPDPPPPQPGQLGQLRLGQGQAVENDLGMLGQQPAGLGRPGPLAGPADQPAPAWRSRRVICRDTAGWVSPSACPAAENDPCPSTARNVASRPTSSMQEA